MRVAVTRPLADGEDLAARLRARGHDAVLAPVMEVVRRPVTLPQERADALLVTSRHALMALSPGQGETLRALPVYAVGASTAAAARAAGFTDVRVSGEDAAALLALVRLTQAPRSALLYLAGAVHKAALPEALATDGHRVIIVVSYETRALIWDDAVLAALHPAPDAWLHLSRRSADLALAQADLHGLGTAFRMARHIGLSADSVGGLRPTGIAAGIAARPTIEALLDQL